MLVSSPYTRLVLIAMALATLFTAASPAQAQGRNRRQPRMGTTPRVLPPVAVETEEFVNTAPVLAANGMLYVGSWNHQIQALDQKTGAVIWKFTTGNIINASPVVGPNGTVYVTSRDKNLYALDGATGAKKWQYTTGLPLNTRPAVSPAGLVYLGTTDKKIIALDAKTGAKRWEQKTVIAASSPALGPNKMVYVSANNVSAFDGATGKLQWTTAVGALPSQAPTVGPDGTVFVGTYDDQILALDGETGDTLWKFSMAHSVDYPLVLGADGTLYACARQRLIAIRASTGQERWELAGDGSAWSAPAVDPEGFLYAGQSDSSLYALNAASGGIKWQFATDDGLLCFPTLSSDGTVYIQTEGNSKVYALNRGTGKVRWTADQDPLPKMTVATPAAGRARGN